MPKSSRSRILDERLAHAHAIIVPGGFGERGTEGMIRAVRFARERKIPVLGICYGLHMMVIEVARDLLGLKRANTSENMANTPDPVIDIMETQRGVTQKGGTMRLGAYPCVIKPGSLAASLYRRARSPSAIAIATKSTMLIAKRSKRPASPPPASRPAANSSR